MNKTYPYMELNQQIVEHWQQLRGMTYDFLAEVTDEQLELKLPFPESQTLGSQIYCMLGTQETFLRYLPSGNWDGWNCSLDEIPEVNKKQMLSQLQAADKELVETLSETDLLIKNAEDTPLQRYMVLVEHESHHQGQIINFIYAHNLPIPKSWYVKWNLTRD